MIAHADGESVVISFQSSEVERSGDWGHVAIADSFSPPVPEYRMAAHQTTPKNGGWRLISPSRWPVAKKTLRRFPFGFREQQIQLAGGGVLIDLLGSQRACSCARSPLTTRRWHSAGVRAINGSLDLFHPIHAWSLAPAQFSKPKNLPHARTARLLCAFKADNPFPGAHRSPEQSSIPPASFHWRRPPEPSNYRGPNRSHRTPRLGTPSATPSAVTTLGLSR